MMKIKTFSIFGFISLFISLIIFVPTSTIYSQSQSPIQSFESGKGISYIDCHNHLHGYLHSRKGPGERDFQGSARVALSTMDRLGITKNFILPPPFAPHSPHIYDYTELIDVVKKYPNRFAFLGGGGTLNVIIHRTANEKEVSMELRSEFKKQALEILKNGAIGFGEMSAEHFSLGPDHIYAWSPPDHPLYLLLADIAAEHNMPIDIHMEAVPEEMPLPSNLRSPPNPKVLKPNIAAFERLLAHNRGAKIIWSHVGWCNTGRRTAAFCSEILKKHPNLYMSFKISPRDSRPECRPIEQGIGLKEEWLRLIRNFPDRFIIGTDYFYMSPRSPRKRIGPPNIEPTYKFFSLLPSDLARKLGQENPLRIFNIEQ